MSKIVTKQNTLKSTKLVKVYVTFDTETLTIQEAKVTGDFFVHPEDSIDTLEHKLQEKNLGKAEVEKLVSECLKDCEIIGFSLKELTDAIIGCATKD